MPASVELAYLVFFARDPVSAEHRILVEVQWREEVVGHLDAGEWRARRGEHADGEAEPAP